MTQKEWAGKMYVKERVVRKWENEGVIPREGVLARMNRFRKLLDGVPEPYREDHFKTPVS